MESTLQNIQTVLRSTGATSARELASRFSISQPTLSRRLSEAGPNTLIRIGKGPSTRYAALEPVSSFGSQWPLYYVDESGEGQLLGVLHSLAAQQWYLEADPIWDTLVGDEFTSGVFPGPVPWFLDDCRPIGFLGRIFARQFGSGLQAPADPVRWNRQHLIPSLLRYGSSLPGNFILGDEMMMAVQESQASRNLEYCGSSTRSSVYPALAEQILQDEWPGTSVAGEQPKFSTTVLTETGSIRDVLVKFSGPVDSVEHRRRADLLVAEAVASRILMQHDIPSARSEIVIAGNRCFLESTRFDRCEERGRKGLVSLYALDSAFFGEMDTSWLEASGRLRVSGWLTEQEAENMSLLWHFGTLIGNTDMHYGNISFFLTPERPLCLAPVYDMLPMLYMPNREGGTHGKAIDFKRPLPRHRELWVQARGMALVFWEHLMDEPQLSDDFKIIAEQNVLALSRIEK